MISKMLLVFIGITSTTIPAWAHDTGRDEVLNSSCETEMTVVFDSDRHEAYSAQIANYFSHLPIEFIELAITLVESEPTENLSALLEITRGVKDSDGKWVKKPLTESEIETLFSGVLQDIGVFTPGRLYNSRYVNRDPILFYEAALDLRRRMASDRMTREDIEMIGRVTIN